MIKEELNKFNFDELIELSSNLINIGSYHWQNYASVSGNLQFFDGIMHILTLPHNTVELVLQHLKSQRNEIIRLQIEKISDSLLSINDAAHWGEITITQSQQDYLVGIYDVLEGLRNKFTSSLITGCEKLVNSLSNREKEDFLKSINLKLDANQNNGHEAPEIN
jgi:hypothetical protein